MSTVANSDHSLSQATDPSKGEETSTWSSTEIPQSREIALITPTPFYHQRLHLCERINYKEMLLAVKLVCSWAMLIIPSLGLAVYGLPLISWQFLALTTTSTLGLTIAPLFFEKHFLHYLAKDSKKLLNDPATIQKDVNDLMKQALLRKNQNKKITCKTINLMATIKKTKLYQRVIDQNQTEKRLKKIKGELKEKKALLEKMYRENTNCVSNQSKITLTHKEFPTIFKPKEELPAISKLKQEISALSKEKKEAKLRVFFSSRETAELKKSAKELENALKELYGDDLPPKTMSERDFLSAKKDLDELAHKRANRLALRQAFDFSNRQRTYASLFFGAILGGCVLVSSTEDIAVSIGLFFFLFWLYQMAMFSNTKQAFYDKSSTTVEKYHDNRVNNYFDLFLILLDCILIYWAFLPMNLSLKINDLTFQYSCNDLDESEEYRMLLMQRNDL